LIVCDEICLFRIQVRKDRFQTEITFIYLSKQTSRIETQIILLFDQEMV
jgi:hypothetical protein